jgi:hypothetical protein
VTRILAAAALVAASLVVITGCGGDDDDDAPASPQRAVTQTIATPEDTSDGLVEVTGIIGAIDAGARVIEINRLSGADVTRISTDDATVLVSPQGARLQFLNLRPSDRIIARGTIDPATGVLHGTRVEVSPAVSGGGEPG